MAYMRTSRTNHATAGSAVTKSMLKTACCKNTVVGARGGLRTRNQANNVSDEDEEEQRAQKRDVLLETLTDNVLANARVHEVIAILDRVEELVLRDQLKLAAPNQNHHQYQRQNEEHVQRVLADVPSTDREYGVGIERFGEVPCLFDELIERFAHLRSSQPFQ